MRKIAGYLSILLLAGLSLIAQQGPSSNLRVLGASLDSLARDTALTDSGRMKVRNVIKVYKGLVQKLKDSIDQARKSVKADTVFVRIPDTTKKQPPVIEAKDKLGKRALVVISVDSVRALMAAVQRDAGGGRDLLLYLALLLIAGGGAGWGLWLAGQQQRVKTRGVKVPVQVPEKAPEKAPDSEVPVLVSVPVGKEADAAAEAKVEAKAIPKGVFVCELMMTAGPRKKFMNEENADKDMGEDVCGCVIRGDTAAVWLLDGTSDQFCLRHPVTGQEYFSSRLLAQDIGDRLREAFEAGGKDGWVLDRMMTEAIEVVRMDWVKALWALPEDERLLLAENIRAKNCPECSSTLLSAVLALDGKASAYRSGDSRLQIFQREDVAGPLIPSEASFTTKNPESNDRIFFRIVLAPSGDIDILCNEPAYEVIHLERVGTLIAFSDGIGPVTAEALKNDYGGNPAGVRRRTGSEKQGTADDKSICFVSITEP